MLPHEPINAAAIQTTRLLRLSRTTGRSNADTLSKAMIESATAPVERSAVAAVRRQSVQ
jgi:hypothetical protein